MALTIFGAVIGVLCGIRLLGAVLFSEFHSDWTYIGSLFVLLALIGVASYVFN